MKTLSRTKNGTPMSADAYAGFLKLWLTPPSAAPKVTPEVEAYLRHVSDREPLSAAARRAIGQPTNRAA